MSIEKILQMPDGIAQHITTVENLNQEVKESENTFSTITLS